MQYRESATVSTAQTDFSERFGVTHLNEAMSTRHRVLSFSTSGLIEDSQQEEARHRYLRPWCRCAFLSARFSALPKTRLKVSSGRFGLRCCTMVGSLERPRLLCPFTAWVFSCSPPGDAGLRPATGAGRL